MTHAAVPKVLASCLSLGQNNHVLDPVIPCAQAAEEKLCASGTCQITKTSTNWASVTKIQIHLRAKRADVVASRIPGPAPEGHEPVPGERVRLGWRCDKCSYLNGGFKNGKFEDMNADWKCSLLEQEEWHLVPSVDGSKVECEHTFDPKCCQIVTVQAEEGWAGETWKEEWEDVGKASGAGEAVDGKNDLEEYVKV